MAEVACILGCISQRGIVPSSSYCFAVEEFVLLDPELWCAMVVLLQFLVVVICALMFLLAILGCAFKPLLSGLVKATIVCPYLAMGVVCLCIASFVNVQ